MKFICGLFIVALTAGGFGLWQHLDKASAHQPPAVSVAELQAGAPAAQASNQEINDKFAKQILATIAGHENEPAEQVFKNIQWLKGLPAGRLVLIMNYGYSKALGVACTHCHVEQDFSSDDKRPKRAAREMAVMHRAINDQLRKMENLTPKPDRAINCGTCHRGAIDPTASER